MKVLLADELGFCFGVERAVEMVEDALAEGDTVRALGPLIHNEQEMQRLGKFGVTTISEPVQIKRGENRCYSRSRRDTRSPARTGTKSVEGRGRNLSVCHARSETRGAGG